MCVVGSPSIYYCIRFSALLVLADCINIEFSAAICPEIFKFLAKKQTWRAVGGRPKPNWLTVSTDLNPLHFELLAAVFGYKACRFSGFDKVVVIFCLVYVLVLI